MLATAQVNGAESHLDTKILENCWSIIVDGIPKSSSEHYTRVRAEGFLRSCHLLADHQTDRNERSVPISFDCPHLTL